MARPNDIVEALRRIIAKVVVAAFTAALRLEEKPRPQRWGRADILSRKGP